MAEMRKLVLRLDLHDDKDKKKAMKAATSLPGIDSISIDMKDKKLTITGEVDPISVVARLRKSWQHTDLLFVGPAKEEKKKEEPKKEGDKDKGTNKDSNDRLAELLKTWNGNIPPMGAYYYVQSAEENPNSCVVL